MKAPHDLTTLVCATLYIVFAIYALTLWSFALLRTGSSFCYFYIVAAAMGLVISITTVILYCDPYIGLRILGQPGWMIFYYAFIILQPLAALLGTIGATLLVRSLTRRSNQAMQPTAGRSGA